MRRADRAVEAVKGDILGKRVLEVACGCAEFSLCAAGLAEQVDCIDLDRGRLDERIGDCPNATFRQMDATALEYGQAGGGTGRVPVCHQLCEDGQGGD